MKPEVGRSFIDKPERFGDATAAKRQRFWRGTRRAGCLAIAIAMGGPQGGLAEETRITTGLPVPRFASLKTDNVEVHAGPGKEHFVTWMFQRAGLPVEITAEFGPWRKIRDFDGTEGWVFHSLLSARRTTLVAPWKKDFNLQLYGQASAGSDVLANLQPGVLGNIVTCTGTWCRIFGRGFDGWEQQTNLWGVYPGERVE